MFLCFHFNIVIGVKLKDVRFPLKSPVAVTGCNGCGRCNFSQPDSTILSTMRNAATGQP